MADAPAGQARRLRHRHRRDAHASASSSSSPSPAPASTGDDHVEIDPRYFRPTEVDLLLGDASKAKEALGWEPKVRFKELVELMVDADVAALEDQMAGKVTRYSHEGA